MIIMCAYFLHRIHLNRSIGPNEYFYDSVSFFGSNISRVEAWDLSNDGNGAVVQNWLGFIGGSFIALTFYGNTMGYGANFEIKFYVDVFRDMDIGIRGDYTGRTVIALQFVIF